MSSEYQIGKDVIVLQNEVLMLKKTVQELQESLKNIQGNK